MDPSFINKVTKVTVRTISLIYFQELVLLKVPTISLSRLVIIDWFTVTISLSRLVIIDWFTITISLTTVEVYTKAVKLHISVSDVCITLVYYLQES